MSIYLKKYKFVKYWNSQRFNEEYVWYRRSGLFPFYKWEIKGYCTDLHACYLVAKTKKFEYKKEFYL